MKSPALDRYLLLAWLHVHEKTARPVVSAIYAGLTERVLRGDFDMPTTPRKGDGNGPESVNYSPVISEAEPSATNTQSGLSTTPSEQGVIVTRNTIAPITDRRTP